MGRVCMVRDLVAELVMGRVCYGPSLSWAEFVMGRDVPESLVQGSTTLPQCMANPSLLRSCIRQFSASAH